VTRRCLGPTAGLMPTIIQTSIRHDCHSKLTPRAAIVNISYLSAMLTPLARNQTIRLLHGIYKVRVYAPRIR